MSDEVLSCPRCGNLNIKKVGEYYQCQAIIGNKDLVSCGFIGKKHLFSSQKRL